MPITIEQKKTASIFNVPLWYNLLKKEGVNENILPYLLAQLALESNYFTSNVYKLNNNPAGITWNNNYLKRFGTSKGSARPASEGGVYVKFDTLETAAKDYLRIVNKTSKLGKPIEADTLENFVDRLKANGYFTDDKQKYKTGLISINKRLSSWNDYAALSKKKSNLASINPIFLLLALGYLAKKFF
jgi:flagellum-specific peptidoglycan hydrolase FlgJ